MIDYRVLISFWLGDVHMQPELVLTIEEDINIEDEFERQELIKDILLEKAKEKLEYNDIELVEIEELTDRDSDIYKLTY